jgi:hydrogenase expression/formation protein HypC
MRVQRDAQGTVWCEGRGRRLQLDISLVGEVPDGTWVLQFHGSARRTMTEEDAALTNAALDALDAAARGATDFDAFFPDLIGRTPQLPAHLRSKT